MHEHFEHTADLGLRITAPNLDTLFVEAAECLFKAIVENLQDVKPNLSTEMTISITAETSDALEYLLVDWLQALLRNFDENRLLYSRFAVKVSAQGLTGLAEGEEIDASRHQLIREVKAITYHGLKVEPHDGGWLAEVIVDI